jgi:hypothetical protein
MNEVRAVVAHMLDGPEPPLRGADEVLRVARQSKRWHSIRVAGAALGGPVAIVLGMALVAGPWLVDGRPARSVVPAAAGPASHGRDMARLMTAAVPSGYAAVPETTFSDSSAPPSGAGTQILSGALVRVFTGPHEGQLYAYLVHDGQPPPSGDLCDASLRPAAQARGQCETRDVGGVPIRVVSYVDPRRGRVVEATRFLRGGRLIVGASQGVSTDLQRYLGPGVYQPDGPLADPPIGPDRAAALAADPAMVTGP